MRQFLACVSRDATCSNTRIQLKVGSEIFSASGQTVEDAGYLDVYHPYEKTTQSYLPAGLAVEGTVIDSSSMRFSLHKK